MRKAVSVVLSAAITLNIALMTGCNKKDPASTVSTPTGDDFSSTTTNLDALAESKSKVMEHIDAVVNEPEFSKKTAQEQQNEVQSILNQYVTDNIITAGTISLDTKTRTYNYTYVDGTNGFYSLNGVKYSVNNEDNLVWNGQEPVVSEPNTDNNNGMGSIVGGNNATDENSNTEDPGVNNSIYIVGVKLNYNNTTGYIQGRFIASNGGAYAFDFTDRFTMMDLDLVSQLNNIIETRSCTYGIDAQTLNELIQLSNNIDYTADLYQTIGDTQQDIISEIIYTYNRKTGLLVECCASGVKESTLNDTDADAFVLALLDALENKVQRINK